MNVTTLMSHNQVVDNLNSLLTSITATEQQVATGAALQEPSDNPVAAAQDLQIRSAQAWNTQWTQNAQAASSYMSTADQALTQLTALLQSASSIAIAAGSGTENAANLQAQAAQVSQLVQDAQGLANTQYGDQYVFGGTSGQAPWNSATGQWNLTAASGALGFEVGQGVTLDGGVDGYALFQGSVGAPSGAGVLTSNGSTTKGVLEQLQSDLASGNTGSLGADAQAIQDAVSYVASLHSGLGASMSRVQTIQSSLQQTATQLQADASQFDSTNMASALATLSSEQTVYQAALAIGSQILQLPTLATLLPGG